MAKKLGLRVGAKIISFLEIDLIEYIAKISQKMYALPVMKQVHDQQMKPIFQMRESHKNCSVKV